jgi:hypothetical protein
VSAGAERELLHRRNYEFAGYRRADGLFEIEGRMTDHKSYAFPNEWRGTIAADEALHDMRIRLVVDDQFRIAEAAAETAAGPYEICPAITPAFQALKGERIGRGWSALLREKFGGVRGCTHHVELLRNLGTVAYQTIYGEQSRRRRQEHIASPAQRSTTRPAIIDSCHAYAADGDVVKTNWPEFHRPKS